jgi:hypothetical protein
MRVACIANANQIGGDRPDLAVLPEYVSPDEIARAAFRLPASIIVGAIQDGQYSRGVLIRKGRHRIDYCKCGTDGHTQGTKVCPAPMPVQEYGDLCVGIIICMDVQNIAILHPVVDQMRASACRHKILCIPAAMQSHWFSDRQLSPEFKGVHTIVSNHPTHHQSRCRSFIADPAGEKVRVQIDWEALHLDLDGAL